LDTHAHPDPPELTRSAPAMPGFLAGTGAQGELIAAFDWAATPLGAIEHWPPCLRIATGMVLRSPTALVLLWGPSGIMIYNEACAALTPQRHPDMLGMGALAAWPEAAALTQEMLTLCLAGGSRAFTDERVTIFTGGVPEDLRFDLAYSPVMDELGQPAGVLVAVREANARALADERLRFAQEAARVGTFEWYPRTHLLVVSDVYRQIYGFAPDEEVTDQKLLAMLPPEDWPLSGNRRIGQPGNPLAYAEYRIRHRATGALRWVARRGEILPGGAGTPERYIGAAWDITEKKTAELQAAFVAALSERLLTLSDPLEVIEAATLMLGQHLGAGRAGYAEIDASGTDVVISREWNDGSLPSLIGSLNLEEFGASNAAALRRGGTVRRDDIRTDPRFTDTQVAVAFQRIGMQSGISVPLIRDGQLRGVLYAHCARPRRWTDEDEAIMQAVAARTWDAAQRARAEQLLRDSEANFRLLAQALPIHVWVASPEGETLWVNDQAYAYTGVPRGDLQRADWDRLVHPDDRDASLMAWTRGVRDGASFEHEYRMLRHDGAWRWHLVRVMPIRDETGKLMRWIGTNTDIDEQRQLLGEMVRLNATLEDRVEQRTRELRQTEEALRQAQKMEAIGQLTGGIAHDFNNLLTGIIGSLELLRRRLTRIVPEADARMADLDRFMTAAIGSANSAAALTHRLLAFARRQSLDRKPVDVCALMHGMAELLVRTLGEQVDLRIEVPPTCRHAMTDANQLESAILNLAINARDAMSAAGRLTIAAGTVVLDAAAASAIGPLDAGDYVCITVTDTGSGMPAAIMERVFEPFFTTKPAGQGTGLGLSMVYGFVRQSGGHVAIASVPGQGTTVSLYLPPAEAHGSAAAAATMPPRGAGQTVLVVEDVAAVRMLIVEVLRDLGYATLEAENAAMALPILGSDAPIELLISDVGLPGLNGRQLADYARTKRPGLKVLFVTGYAEDAALRSGFLAAGTAIMCKPFAIAALAVKVGEMMESR
jgi:PAS domain S-box-containing protein